MNDVPDAELLAEFARNQSEAAFAALVERHLGLVHSVAARHTSNPQHAQDISQAVFIILARKAGSLGGKIVLAGWLYHTARLTAANFQRAEARRIHREQEAYMGAQSNEPEASNPGKAEAEVWRALSPQLEAAMAHLGHADRDALVLRYFQNKNLTEVGAALGVAERAAQKRVSRALEKLRKFFSQRGVTLSVAAIAGAVSANSVQAAPTTLAIKISGVAAKGLATTNVITTLVKGTMKTMNWMKLKFAMGVGVAALVAGGAAALAVSQAVGGDQLTVSEIARQTQAAYAALSSYRDTCTGTAANGATVTEATGKIQLQRPLLYRVEWTSAGGLYPSRGLAWSDGGANFYVSTAADKFEAAPGDKIRDMQQAFAFAGGSSGSLASTIPAAFFNLSFGDSLAVFATGRTKTKRLADEKVGEVDCYVVVSILDGSKMKVPDTANVKFKSLGTTTTTLWIGKEDHLIRKVRTVSAGQSFVMKWTDEMLTRQLTLQNKPVTPENLAALRADMEKAQAAAGLSDFVFTETHDNISVNQNFPRGDFAR